MKRTRILQVVLFLSFLNFVVPAAAQLPIATPVNEMEQRRIREQEYHRLRSIQAAARQSNTAARREELKARATPKDIEAVQVEKEDKARFAAFLKQPRTGIFRLHDIANCEESEKVYNVEEPCPSHIVDKGSGYSFHEEDYDYRLLADISLEKANLRIRKIETLSFLTNLGDVPIENLTLAASGIREMAEFVPSLDKKEVLAQHRIASRGFQVGKHVYKTSRPLKENSTYALRAITYRIENPSVSIKTKRLDVIVVFRVVRAHDDGSVSILWKELQRKEAPKLMNNRFVADGSKPDAQKTRQKFAGN
jgi:hypothetical protein